MSDQDEAGYPIVINTCIGGYRLPDVVVDLYAKKKGMILTREVEDEDLIFYFTEDGEAFIPEHIPRHDPCLISAVKEVTKTGAHSTRHCTLEIKYIEESKYKVEEICDGREVVITPNSMEEEWVVIER